MRLLYTCDEGVGKSAIMTRFSDNIFVPAFTTTIGIDFNSKMIRVDKAICKLEIWFASHDVDSLHRMRMIDFLLIGQGYSGSRAILHHHSELLSRRAGQLTHVAFVVVVCLW